MILRCGFDVLPVRRKDRCSVFQKGIRSRQKYLILPVRI
jgi:hypothetical protein